MNVLEHQVRAFRAHYTPMRAKMGEMWNGISNFADNFVEVWNQWGPAERKAFFGRALATVEGNLNEPKAKFQTLLRVACPELTDENMPTSGTVRGMSIKRFIEAVLHCKENDRKYPARKVVDESIRVFMEAQNYSIFDQFKNSKDERTMTMTLLMEQRTLWLVNFCLCLIAEMCGVFVEQGSEEDEGASTGSQGSPSDAVPTGGSAGAGAGAGAGAQEARGGEAPAKVATSAASTSSLSCDLCGTTGEMMRCARCKSVYYCSRECQKKAWKSHKAGCKAPAS